MGFHKSRFVAEEVGRTLHLKQQEQPLLHSAQLLLVRTTVLDSDDFNDSSGVLKTAISRYFLCLEPEGVEDAVYNPEEREKQLDSSTEQPFGSQERQERTRLEDWLISDARGEEIQSIIAKVPNTFIYYFFYPSVTGEVEYAGMSNPSL